ncbi:MAG: hypothetical protein ABEJ95_05540 [Candidatus Nanohalobium sp.]
MIANDGKQAFKERLQKFLENVEPEEIESNLVVVEEARYRISPIGPDRG